MWRRALSTKPENPTPYSFLQPSIFALKHITPSKPTNLPKTLTPDQRTSLESTLQESLLTSNTDEAWKSFKTLTTNSVFPSKSLINSLLSHLSSLSDTYNLKRAFASVIYVVEKNPDLLHHETIETVLNSMKCADAAAPAFALVKCMFKNRYFVPFRVWGCVLVDTSRKSGNFGAFLRVFNENCRVALSEKLEGWFE